MNEIILSLFGAVLFLLAEQHLNRINKGTRTGIKISFWSLASGAIVLAVWPWLGLPVWLLIAGVALVTFGGACLVGCNQYEGNIFGCRNVDRIFSKIRGHRS